MVGGLLILGLLAFFLFKRSSSSQGAGPPEEMPVAYVPPVAYEPKQTVSEEVRHTPLRYLDPDDPVAQQHLEPVGARLGSET